MFVKSTLSALALAVTIPFAGAAFAGNDQLAKIAGVEPGIYTTAELIQIDEARKTYDDERLAYFLNGENRVSRNSATGSTSDAVRQLASIAGVSTAGYTAGTLHELIEAQRDFDDEKVAFIKARAAGEISDLSPTAVSAGKQQLADLVGKDASAYSIAELNQANEEARDSWDD